MNWHRLAIGLGLVACVGWGAAEAPADGPAPRRTEDVIYGRKYGTALTMDVFRPGGKAIVVDLLPHDREDFRRQMGQASMGFGDQEMLALLRDAGFTRPVARPLPPEPNVKGPALMLSTGIKP